MPGAPDPLYIAARRVLLDALHAVRGHLDAFVLVGAQAVYIHTGNGDLAVAPYTTDGDIAIDPRLLGADPVLEQALSAAGFGQAPSAVGIWSQRVEISGAVQSVNVDFLVPDSLGGGGRRGARIPPHGNNVARKAVGLEAALVDRDRRHIAALEAADDRRFEMWVAGPAGLLVAKVHKIGERVDAQERLRDKDALDVYRLLQTVPTDEITKRMRRLEDNELSRDVTRLAVELLPKLFGSPTAPGCRMAVRNAGRLVDSDTLAASLVALTEDLLRDLAGRAAEG